MSLTCAGLTESILSPLSSACWNATGSANHAPSAFLIDAPDGQGSKSAFQPIGRLLLDAKKRGIVFRIETLLQESLLVFIL